MTRLSYSRPLTRFALMAILLVGFGWRAFFVRETNPGIDEFITMLASQSVQGSGLPILPSGLFYTHGFLFSIVDGIFVGLLRISGGGFLPEALHFSYRVLSLFLGVLTISLIYRIGCDWFSPVTGLIAAGILAISPDAILRASHARMYSLTMLLTLLLTYATYKTISSRDTRRWQVVMLLALITAFMSHFLTILFLPTLVIGAAILAWRVKLLKGRLWFLNVKTLIVWGLVVGGTILGSALLQSRSLPPNAAVYTSEGAVESDLSLETVATLISHQLSAFSDWHSVDKFLARFFWENTFNLTLFAVILGGGIALALIWIFPKSREFISAKQRWEILFLFIITIGPLFALIFLVEPDRRVPRYAAPFLPIIFLLAASIVGAAITALHRWQVASRLFARGHWTLTLLALAVVLVFWGGARTEISELLYFSPAAYDKAFRFVKQHWQPGDVVLTPYTAASGLYLGRADYFAADVGAVAALFDRGNGAPIDRYWGAPWIGSGRQLQELLRIHPRAWFVVNEPRYTNYYRADWHFVEQQNMKLVWTQDMALVYLSHAPGIPLPDEPEHLLNANLSNVAQLRGYTSAVVGSAYRVFLFWKVLAPISNDLTQFVHIRSEKGETIAQADFEPLKGQYSTSRWKVGETVVDVIDIPVPAELPAGKYRVLAGLYRWDTLERLPVVNDTTGENAIELETVALQ